MFLDIDMVIKTVREYCPKGKLRPSGCQENAGMAKKGRGHRRDTSENKKPQANQFAGGFLFILNSVG
jgi:hypothetical protein